MRTVKTLPQSPRSRTQAPPIVFGEVLFDCFPDGSQVLGGAPFNVAWHLQGFGAQPLLVTRVGDDTRGRDARQAMQRWGMSLEGVQLDHHRPTGVVTVSLENGQPTFDIEEGQAYDAVQWDERLRYHAGHGASVLYHGTLASRAPESRATLAQLRGAMGAPVFLDINLRAPWWTREVVQNAVSGAQWIKLNEDELPVVLAQMEVTNASPAALLDCQPNLHAVLLTLGEKGAVYQTREGERHATAAGTVTDLADAVGAGDAFSAVALLGTLRGWSLPVTLRRAAAFAARVCGIRGATCADRRFYDVTLETWHDDNDCV